MAEISSFVDGVSRQLQRPISDLDDVRETMAALQEVQQAEIRIDTLIGPVEESFTLLNRHELFFSDGNAEKIDGVMYAWKELHVMVREVFFETPWNSVKINSSLFTSHEGSRKSSLPHLLGFSFCKHLLVNVQWPVFILKVKGTQDKLLEVQPQMKAELVSGVEIFQKSVQDYFADYDNR